MEQNKLIITASNLPETDENHLNEVFVTFGPIVDIKLDAQRHVANIQYQNLEDASAAIDNMHKSQLLGNTLAVKHATREI